VGQDPPIALLKHSLELAIEHDIPSAALRAHGNLYDLLSRRDRHDEAIEQGRQGVALARKAGSRLNEWLLGTNHTFSLFMAGRWDEALAAVSDIPESQIVELTLTSFLAGVLPILVNQGKREEADKLFGLLAGLEDSADVQDRSSVAAAKALMLRQEGDLRGALVAAEKALSMREQVGVASEDVKAGFVQAVEAAFGLGDESKVEELVAIVELLPQGELPPSLRAQATRFRARLSSARDDSDGAASGFKSAAGMFRELGMPFWMAVTLLEHGEWLTQQGRADEAQPLLEEARNIFEQLEARPWLERLGTLPVAATAGRATGP
jgi:tetratricopeptide (TPR) repeat protein